MEKFQHGGQIYKADGSTGDWLDFSANINPLGLSPFVKKALAENIGGIVNYPDPAVTELKNALTAHYKIPAENLVLLNGAAEFFYLFLNTFRPKKVTIPVPSFSEYEKAAVATNCEINFFVTKAAENFSVNIEKLIKEIVEKGSDCVIIGQPNNPTGTFLSVEKILRLAKVAKVIVDESFIDFLPNAESCRNFVDGGKIFAVQSLTKFFAIPGLRLGFAVAEKKFAERLNFCKDVWNVNFLAQKAGVAALADEKFISSTRERLKEEKKFFVGQLKKIRKVEVFEPSANFVLFRVNSDKAKNLLKKMRDEKILLRSCENFVGLDEKYFRSAIRSREENIRLLDALKNFSEDF